jgi:hypothetical protein
MWNFCEWIDDFKEALSAARALGGINLIEIPLDPSFLSPGKTIG